MRVTLLDGPVGTELTRRGVPTPLPGWSAAANLSHPDVVEAIHRDYAEAGALVHTTNTFRTQPHREPAHFEARLRAAVEAARRGVGGVARPSMRIAGSMAPLEDCYRPDLSPGRAARPVHARMARALADAGCDLLLCETFPAADEALAACDAALETGLPVWLALTAGPDDDLMAPETMRDTARSAVALGVEVVLVNCVPVAAVERRLDALAAVAPRYGAYANAGRPDDAMGWATDETLAATRYAGAAMRWVDHGACVVGGCCGTTPAHVRALASRLASASQAR